MKKHTKILANMQETKRNVFQVCLENVISFQFQQRNVRSTCKTNYAKMPCCREKEKRERN